MPATLQANPAPNPSYLQAAGLSEAATMLPALPMGLGLAAVDEPLHYDPARRVLVYRGLMGHASYQYLRGITNDLAFCWAIDQLYQASTFRGRPWGVSRSVVALVLAASGVAGGLSWWLVR